MQDTYKIIFELARDEVPRKHFTFSDHEEAVIYKGFKISKVKGVYKWEDTRYSNYYEVVDPKITENILISGFAATLNLVMLHNDKEKITICLREIARLDKYIQHWSVKSTKLWNNFRRRTKLINNDNKIANEIKNIKKASLKSRYDNKKLLYQKKRKVLGEEKQAIKEDLKFFESRLKTYNN